MEQYEHLTDAQIEYYGENTAGAGPDQAQQVEDHLAECPGCRARVLAFHRARFAPASTPMAATASAASSAKSMTDSSRTTARRPDDPAPDCPREDSLRDLAAGLTPPDQAAPLIHHAAECAHCGPILRMYTEDFSDDLTPEDQALLPQLRSSSPEWQKKLVRELQVSSAIARPDTSSKPIFKLPRFGWTLAPATAGALAAVAVIASITGAVLYARRDTPEKAEKLLAKAYTEQRTTEMRWPEAAYAQMRVTRGPEDSRFNKPRALLDAEGIIARKQPESPNDARWLQAKAQADILERNPEAAIAGLDKALDAQPDSVALLIDLGIAYDLQAEISDDPRSLEQAIESFGKALQKDSTNRAALFNRALLYERVKFIDSAIADLEMLLQNETDQGWKQEGQNRLNALRELKRKQSSIVPPQSVAAWVAVLESNTPDASENALDTAVLEWLPKLDSANPQKDPGFLKILEKAAEKLESDHNDKWLLDMLRTRASPHFAAGVAALQTSVLLNSQGKATDAIAPARQAQTYFRRDHNLAGLARALLEEVYAYQRSAEGTRCLNTARSFRRTDLSTYNWIRVQLLLDEASCFNIAGRLEEARSDADDALLLAKKSAYRTLSLRALGIGASLATTRGDNSLAIKQDLEGLQQYWSGTYPLVRAYQFYSDLSFNSETTGLWHLTYAADGEATSAISQTANKQVEAIARYRLAKAAVMVGQSSASNNQISVADRLLAGLPQTESSTMAQIQGSAGIIRAYLDSGQNQRASDRLNNIVIPERYRNSRLILRAISQLRGDVALKLGHLSEAEGAYYEALLIADSSLSTLHDARDRSVWTRENELIYRTLTEIQTMLRRPIAALEVWDRYRSSPIRNTASISVDSPRTTVLHPTDPLISTILPRFQSAFHDQTLISYVFLHDKLGIWLLDRSASHFEVSKASSREIRLLARRFVAECSDPASDMSQLRTDGKKLYEALISPVGQYLRQTPVLVIQTDAELDSVPFEALVDANEKYLRDSFDIVLSAGLQYSEYLRPPRKTSAENRALIIGDPTIDRRWRNLPRLPSAKIEAQAIASRFPHSLLLTDESANYSTIKKELNHAEVFHFAGHAIQSNAGAMLLLAEGSSYNQKRNTLSDLGLSPASAEHLNLVVLSACDTGTKQANSPESFVQPFLLARVPQVVVSRWQIDSNASIEFMRGFYARLLSGSTVPQSIRETALSIRQNRQHSHPYYWAAFLVIGRS